MATAYAEALSIVGKQLRIANVVVEGLEAFKDGPVAFYASQHDGLEPSKGSPEEKIVHALAILIPEPRRDNL